MNLNSSRTRLEMLTKGLLMQWEDTKEYWRDAKGQEFERKYINELTARVDKAATILEKLDVVLTKVRNDCE